MIGNLSNEIIISKVANGWVVILPVNNKDQNSPFPKVSQMKDLMRGMLGVMHEDQVLGPLQDQMNEENESDSLYIEPDNRTFTFAEHEQVLAFLSGILSQNDSRH